MHLRNYAHAVSSQFHGVGLRHAADMDTEYVMHVPALCLPYLLRPRSFTRSVMEVADVHCSSRVVALHEGGYSDLYVPFCGLATVEQLAGVRSDVPDPFLEEVMAYGYQDLQPHQQAVISKSREVVALMRSRLAGGR